MFVAAALLGLIALLATLQYRWLGQVSAAERERMQTNLAGRATAFAQDFDREITRAYLMFQLDPLDRETNVAAHVAQRFESWQASSRFPRLVKDVYVVPRGQSDVPLQRFNPSTRLIEPADWPAILQPVHAAREGQGHRAGDEGAACAEGAGRRLSPGRSGSARQA